MFDVGFSELLVIAVVALLVLGPERLPKAARFAGLWVRRARAQWNSVKSEFERDLASDELKRGLRDTQDSLREAQDSLRNVGSRLRREVESASDDVMRGPALPAAAGRAAPGAAEPGEGPPADSAAAATYTPDLFDPDRVEDDDIDRHDPEMDAIFEADLAEAYMEEDDIDDADAGGVEQGVHGANSEPSPQAPGRRKPTDIEDDPRR
jgi:sec-independent protein translocase protein TatB